MSYNNSNDLIYQKEKEWRDLLVSELENTKSELKRLQFECDDTKDKYDQLHADFRHNLNLLSEREDELRQVENENETLHDSMCNYEAKISEMSVEIDRMRDDVIKSERTSREMKDKMERLKEKHTNDVNVIRDEKVFEIERVRSELGVRVRELERSLTEMEEVRCEKVRQIEGQAEAREDEARKERDDAHWRVVQHEMRYRLASKELEMCRASKAELVAQLAEKDESLRVYEMRMGEMELAGASEASIERMRAEQAAMTARELQLRLEKEVDKLARKVAARDEALKAKSVVAKRLEVEMRALVDRAREGEKELEKEIGGLREKLERLEEALDNGERVLSGKDAEIARLVSRMTEEVSNRDGELRNVRSELDTVRRQLRTKQEELLELRNELEYAVGRDIDESRRKECDKESLEARIESVRVEEMAKVESMIRTVTRTRDEALAEVRELRRQIDERKEVRICTKCSQSVQKETDNVDDRVKHLETQNEQLKEVISRMTDEATKEVTLPPPSASPNNKHIATLAERNRQLQQEKIDLLASSRKLQAKYEGLEGESGDMKRLVRERDTEISQVRFELDSLKRHSGLDNRTLRRRAQELETELEMCRKESGEYYKGNLELGRIVEDLQAELTMLKSEEFGRVPSLNLGAQEMIIEQLKNEISELRCRLGSGELLPRCGDKEESREITVLKGRLRTAASHIKNLANEKQVLIQLSNRMRSELKQAGVKMSSEGTSGRQRLDYRVDSDPPKDVSHTMLGLESKLSQLQHLQRDIKDNYDGGRRVTITAKEAPSSLGGQSLDEVFRLLDDSDSLGKSSVCGNETGRELPTGDGTTAFWSRTVRLNPRKVTTKRNMVTNRG